jgi:DNA (cytosine-5)-methyltransferase 1
MIPDPDVPKGGVVAKVVHARSERPRAAEFFAGIGLVRAALDSAGFEVVFANDIEPDKQGLYAANFKGSDFRLGDVRDVSGDDIPDVELATASFPCTDLSLAGNRAGLAGRESSMFWQFARVLDEMGERRPFAVMLENVVGFSTSHGGKDMHAALVELNRLGYWCDILVADARWFVPQSRPRMFIVGSREPFTDPSDWQPSAVRPRWVAEFVAAHPGLSMQAHPMSRPGGGVESLADVVERLSPRHARWWDEDRLARFLESLSPIQQQRVEHLRRLPKLTWRTAYRRTRQGKAVWEIRADPIAGCLRTARGGSSKQALVEAGRGGVRVRWLTPREYARLQGADDYVLEGARENQAFFGFGDAVCVPVVAWLAREYLRPLVDGQLTSPAMRSVTG